MVVVVVVVVVVFVVGGGGGGLCHSWEVTVVVSVTVVSTEFKLSRDKLKSGGLRQTPVDSTGLNL